MLPISRRSLLSALPSLVVPAVLGRGELARAAAPAAAAPAAIPSLRDAAAAKGILYGSCAAAPQILSPDDFTALLQHECACIVPENEMKWAEMSPGPEQEDYRIPDRMVAFAHDHQLAFRAHTLLWYWRTPGWFVALPDRRSAEKAMLRRVTEMASRYRGKILSWDVVNEPLKPDDGRLDALRQAIFLDKIGPEYLDLAYHAARAADPRAQLVVNEYDIEYDTPEQDIKRAAVLKLIERMKKAGTPVDVLGVQAHLSVDRLPFSAAKLRRFLTEAAALGVSIHITELDVTDERAPAGIAERDQLIADEYARFLEVALDERAVRVVITWGLSDRHSWIVRHEQNDQKQRKDGLASRPLLFDAELGRKPAWTAVMHAFSTAPVRRFS